MSSLGTLPIGAGPVGGVFGTDGVPPVVYAISPMPGDTGQSPLAPIQFDVLDFEGNYASFTATVNGVPAHNGTTFLNGWTGSVAVITNGRRVTLLPPVAFPDGSTVAVVATGSDTSGNIGTSTWSYAVSAAAPFAALEVLGNRCLRLSFSPGMRVDATLLDNNSYGLSVRVGYAVQPYARTVTAASEVYGDVVTSVIICMRELFSLGGRYRLDVSGLTDEFGRSVTISLPFDT